MRILLIRSDVKMAGPAKVMHVYAQEMRKRGHHVIFASGGGPYLDLLVADGFQHVMLESLQVTRRSLTSIPKTVAAIRRIIRDERIDVVNSFNAHTGMLAAAADPFSKARHLNTVNGTGKEWANRVLPGLIIAVSGHVRERLLAAGVPERKIRLVYNSTLEDRFFSPAPARPITNGRDGAPVRLVNVAMFTGQKGHEKLIPLAADMVRSGLNITLTLVGDGPTRANCETLASSLGIADRVHFAGALADVVPALDAADIFVHLPDFETFGIVLAEAMARKLPVLSLRLGGIPEVVLDGETGLLVDSDDHPAEKTARLITDPAYRHQLGSAGAQRAKALFSRPTLADNIERLYQGEPKS
jgi:glycosyltransferase involved in cell wall biosynthesis